jgi:hypothetical protein
MEICTDSGIKGQEEANNTEVRHHSHHLKAGKSKSRTPAL